MSSADPIPRSRRVSSLPLFFAYVILIAVLLTILTGAVTALFIRGIDDILYSYCERADFNSVTVISDGGGSDLGDLRAFADIFSALDHAKLDVHGIIPAILAFVFTLFVALVVRRGKKRGGARFVLHIIIAVILGAVLFALSFAVSVYLTEVNDIRFGTVMLSLYENLEALGGLS